MLSLIASGKIHGFSSSPKCIETYISRVFIFHSDNCVLKVYKRDNAWWNAEMCDISKGASRINFIRQDFLFNQFLNPLAYRELKSACVVNDAVELIDPKETDDELVIVMGIEQVAHTFSNVLVNNQLSLEKLVHIGRAFAQKKQSIPAHFLPPLQMNWYEQLVVRLRDIRWCIRAVPDFPQDVGERGARLLEQTLEAQRDSLIKIQAHDLMVCIDCTSENLVYSNNTLRFLDAYCPKDNWRIGTFDLDVGRIASDIHAFCGAEACDAFLQGIHETVLDKLNTAWLPFYKLYGALIMGPYFFMLHQKDGQHLAHAQAYLRYVEQLINSYRVII